MKNNPSEEIILSELDNDFGLSKAEQNFYQVNGYIKLKNVLSTQVINFFNHQITNKVNQLNNHHKPMHEHSTYEKAFLQVMNLWRDDEKIKKLVFSKRLAKIAADVMMVEGVRLYHDQALYKEPGGGITPFHADQFYWPLSSDKTVTAWIPLQDVTLYMGPLSFAEKSQSVAIGRDQEISDESEKLIQVELKERGFNMNTEPFNIGEISYHSGWTFHRAGPNESKEVRKVMTIIYMDKDIKIIEPKNKFQENDWRTWCSSQPINQVPNGPLNPILFSY